MDNSQSSLDSLHLLFSIEYQWLLVKQNLVDQNDEVCVVCSLNNQGSKQLSLPSFDTAWVHKARYWNVLKIGVDLLGLERHFFLSF